MYSIELVQSTLLKQLNELKSIEFPCCINKVSLNHNGLIHTISREKMVPFNDYDLAIIKQSLRGKYEEPLIKFLIAYLVKAKSLNYIDYIFKDLFEEFKLYLEGKYVYRTISLIHHLDIQNQKIEFQDFVIRPIDIESIEYFYNSLNEYDSHFKPTLNDIGLDNHKPNPRVLFERKQILNNFSEIKQSREQIIKLAQSILLYNGTLDHIYFSPVITFSYFDNSGMFRSIEYINEINNRNRKKNVVISDASLLNSYFDKLIKLPKKSVAIDRMTSAHNKVDLEDKFIDLAISLESMYPSISAELKFKISLYTATLLDRSQETYQKVSNLYKVRSHLVHGNSKYTREQLIKELTEIDKLVRKMIIKLLENGSKLEVKEEDILKILLPN